MSNQPFVSIIIPCKRVDDYAEECVKHCLDLDYSNFEVLLLPDNEQEISFNDSKVKIIPTGIAKPSEKRNVGIEHSNGDICAFIDADAYPDKGWLINSVKYLKNSSIAAVGGPSITPSSDHAWQKASGLILASRLGGGGLAYRYTPGKIRDDEDLPTCNLLVFKLFLDELGGFNVDYWPGEDTYLALQISRRLKMRMVYAPDVVVYHHRRPLFRPHLRQVWGYGLHRGYFAKKFPETSRKPIYFMPSIFTIGLMGGLLLSIFNPLIAMLYLGCLAVYLMAVLVEGLKTKNIKMAFLVFTGTVLTHITYGIAFLKGLLSRSLKE